MGCGPSPAAPLGHASSKDKGKGRGKGAARVFKMWDRWASPDQTQSPVEAVWLTDDVVTPTLDAGECSVDSTESP